MASGQKVVAVCGGPKEIDLPLGLGNAGEFHDGSNFLDDYTHLYPKNWRSIITDIYVYIGQLTLRELENN